MSAYTIGEEREIDGVLMRVVSLGSVADDGTLEVEDGQTILADGPPALVEFLDDEQQTVAVWRSIDSLREEARLEAVQVEIDGRMPELRAKLVEAEASGQKIALPLVAAYLRAAYGKGYCDALTEANPGEMVEKLGFDNPAKGRRDADA